MPVLILAIASCLVFFAIVVLLLIADALESRTIRHKRNLMLGEPLARHSIAKAFDPIYSVLWEAPVAALKLIDSAGISGIPVAKLRPIYEEAALRGYFLSTPAAPSGPGKGVHNRKTHARLTGDRLGLQRMARVA